MKVNPKSTICIGLVEVVYEHYLSALGTTVRYNFKRLFAFPQKAHGSQTLACGWNFSRFQLKRFVAKQERHGTFSSLLTDKEPTFAKLRR